MNSSALPDERPNLLSLACRSDFDAALTDQARRIGAACSEGDVLEALREAADRIGANSACFVSVLREDDTCASYRYLGACESRWAVDYLHQQRYASDPWLRYARQFVEPIEASAIRSLGAAEEATVQTARDGGFRSALIVPAAATRACGRTDVLYIGSVVEDYFDSAAVHRIRPTVRSLAMELALWVAVQMRREFVANCGLNAAEVELLRCEQGGHRSKTIARSLGITPETVDCRFQRVNAKLGTRSRGASLYLLELYGVL